MPAGEFPRSIPATSRSRTSRNTTGNSGGLEYEAAWALGADTGVDDLDALTYVNFLCNEDGMDPITYGATVAAAMEMFEDGVITTEHTGGIELRSVVPKPFVAITEQFCAGEGFAADLGLGSKRLCEKYGRPELSMTVKGQEFPAYDPRGIQGIGLAYATSESWRLPPARLHHRL